MFWLDVAVGAVAAFLLFGPAIYAGLDVLPGEEPVEYPAAAATGLLGVALAGFVDLLLGWIPVVGVLFAPIAWSVVVARTTDASPPGALAVGTGTWALSVLLYAGLGGL